MASHEHTETDTKLAKHNGISRPTVKKCRDELNSHLAGLSADQPEYFIPVDRALIDRLTAILKPQGLSDDNIHDVFYEGLGIPVSPSTLRQIGKKYGAKAKKYNESVPLDHVENGCFDEIYQADIPYFVIVDADTYYVVHISREKDRKEETWIRVNEGLKQRQHFYPGVNVADDCGSLQVALKKSFPTSIVRLDTFHGITKVYKCIARFTESSLKRVEGLARTEESIRKLKAQIGDKEENHKPTVCAQRKLNTLEKQYEEQNSQVDCDLEKADELNILQYWIKQLVGYSGYDPQESEQLLNWICDEIEQRADGVSNLQDAIEAFRKNIPRLLDFLKQFYEALDQKEQEIGLTGSVLHQLYHLRTFYGKRYKEEKARFLHDVLDDSEETMEKAREILHNLMKAIKRASSPVENTNSRLRPVLDDEREPSPEVLSLAALWMNARHTSRSMHKDWVGTSALERLTHCGHVDYLDILGIPRPQIFAVM